MAVSASKPATMRDVARLAGVSLKTVSRVINHEVHVSEQIVSRVQHAVSQLNYQHNTVASQLRRADGRTATLGLLLDDVANPFSAALQRQIEDAARAYRTLVFAVSSDQDATREREILQALVERRVDGLIIVPTSLDQRSLTVIQQLGRPVVFVDRPDPTGTNDSVVADNRAASAQAVAHLARAGHQRIALLGDRATLWTAAERHLGYIEGLASLGLRLDPTLVVQDLRNSTAAEMAVHTLLDMPNPPTALFASQNLLTIGAARALRQRQQQQQVALLGFDDVPLADLLDPPISVIAQDLSMIGATAARLLFARLAGEQFAPQQSIVPCQLIARGSGEI